MSVYRTIGPLVSLYCTHFKIKFQMTSLWAITLSLFAGVLRRHILVYTVCLCPIKGRQAHMSSIMRKPHFCLCENKDADQPRSNCKADQHLCFSYTDSTIVFFGCPKGIRTKSPPDRIPPTLFCLLGQNPPQYNLQIGQNPPHPFSDRIYFNN